MALPSIPTDNLYKFLAVSGVVLVSVAIIFPLQRYDEYDRQMWRDIELATARTHLVSTQLDLAVSETLHDLNTPTTRSTNWEKQRNALQMKEKEEAKKVRDLEGSDPEYDTWRIKWNRFQRWFWASVIAGSIGFVMMVVGFVLWYFKLQRHQDRAVRLQATGPAKNS